MRASNRTISALAMLARKVSDKLTDVAIDRAVRQAIEGRNPRSIRTQMTGAELNSLYELARSLPPKATCVEIGSYHGASSVYMSAAISDGGGRLFCVDTWENQTMPEGLVDTFDTFTANTVGLEKVIVPLRMRSRDAYRLLPEKYEFAFIDGDHSYDAVSEDVSAVNEHISEHGFLALHDWRYFPGVAAVVFELLSSTRWKVIGCVDNLVWLTQMD